MRRFVVDANTLASGSVEPDGDSPPCLLYRELAGEARFEAVVCPELLEEVAETLGKPYFFERAGGEGGIEDIVGGIGEAAIAYDNPSEVEAVLRDPEDDYLLALAHEAGAEAIVTGDKDLLEHAGELEVAVLSAREACELLGLGKAPEPEEAPEPES